MTDRDNNHRLPTRRDLREGQPARPDRPENTSDESDVEMTQAMPWRPGAFGAGASASPPDRAERPSSAVAPLPGARPQPGRTDEQLSDVPAQVPRDEARTKAISFLRPREAEGTQQHAAEFTAAQEHSSASSVLVRPSAAPQERVAEAEVRHREADGSNAFDEAPIDALQAKLSKRSGQSAGGRVATKVRGLIRSDDVPGQLAQAWERSQTPMPIGRRAWVTGAHGGAGATTVAVCLAQELHARRADGAALVDAAPGRVGAVNRLPKVHAPVATALDGALERSRDLLSFAPASDDIADAGRLGTALRRVAGVAVTDGGQQFAPVDDQIECAVLVADSSIRGVRAILRALQDPVRIRRPLVVFTQVSPSSGLSGAAAVKLVEPAGVPAFALEHDEHLATGGTVDISRLGPKAALGLSLIAAAVVDEVVGRR